MVAAVPAEWPEALPEWAVWASKFCIKSRRRSVRNGRPLFFYGSLQAGVILADLLLMYWFLYTASQICGVGEFALQASCL